jgi:hypothetical protein
VPNLIFPPCRCLDLQRKEGLMPIREKIGGKLLVGGGSGGAEEMGWVERWVVVAACGAGPETSSQSGPFASPHTGDS